MWRGKPNDSRNLFKLEQPITRRFLNYFSRCRRQSIKNQIQQVERSPLQINHLLLEISVLF